MVRCFEDRAWSSAICGTQRYTSGEFRKIKQNMSDTSARGGSFAGAGIIQGLDLSISSSRNE